MNVWLMKTFKDWGNLFLTGPFFVAIDEDGVDTDYGRLDYTQRTSLFSKLQQAGNSGIQYGLVKRFFDNFYEVMEPGDVIILGLGQRTQFYVTAVLRIVSAAYFHTSAVAELPRHRRNVEMLWRGGPFPVEEWGGARRLELLDSLQRYKELTQVLVRII